MVRQEKIPCNTPDSRGLRTQHVVVTDEPESDDDGDDGPDDDGPDDDEPDDDEPDDDEPDDGDVAKTKQRQAKRKRRKKNKAQRKQRRKNRRTKSFSPSTDGGVDRRQSLHDSDARLGKKGTGYLAHITETVGNDHTPEMITSVMTTPANASDARSTEPLIAKLESKDRGATTYLADAGYGTAEVLMAVEGRGTELITPMRNPWPRRPNDMLTREDFDFDAEGHVTRCPNGEQPLQHAMRTSSSCKEGVHLHVLFDAATCSRCPHRQRCPVTNLTPRGKTKLCIAPHLRRRDERLREQKQPDFRELYRARSGIEATNSELKRKHGLDRLPVRGLQKVATRVLFKAVACNIKRWAKHVAQAA